MRDVTYQGVPASHDHDRRRRIRRYRRGLLFVLALACLAVFLCGQAPGEANKEPAATSKLFNLAGTYRLRGETQDGFNIKTYGTEAGEAYLLSRLRLEIDARSGSLLRIHAQIQDARSLGLTFSDKDFAGGNNPYHDPFDINQLYLEARPSKHVGLIVGRQTLSYGDRRVFGPGDWGNTGRYAWDALRLEIDERSFSSHWLVGRFVLHDPDRWPNTRTAGPTAFASYNSIKNLPFDLDVFYVGRHDDSGSVVGESGPGNLSSHSAGFRAGKRGSRWDYSVMLVRQFGHWGLDDIRAHGAVLSVGYSSGTGWKPRVAVQYVLGSGDADPEDGIHGTFDGLFSGADTVLYGWMNLFFWQNLREFRVDLDLTPSESLSFRGEYHLFGLDERKDAWYFPGRAVRRDETGSSGRSLGQEIDLTLRTKVCRWLEVLGGACYFFPGEFAKRTGPSPVASWCFLETTFYF